MRYNGYHFRAAFRFWVSFLLIWASSLTLHAQVNKSMFVGDTYKCDLSGQTANLISDMVWTNPDGMLKMTGSGLYRDVQILQYFSGTATVRCTWKERYTYNGTQYSRTAYWSIKCVSDDVSISPEVLEMKVGETRQLSYSHQYGNYWQYADVFFSSSSQNISCTRDGRVTAHKAGSATVNVYSKLSAESPYCRITIVDEKPTSISIPSIATAYVGETVTIPITLIPSTANTSITWHYSASPSGALTPAGNGVFMGESEGTANVYCTTDNGLTSNTCKVSIGYRTPTSVSVSDPTLTLRIGAKKKLTATVAPSNAKYTLTWRSNDSNVATVATDGTIEAVGAGTTTITATTDNGKSAACTVTVPPDPVELSIPKSKVLSYRSEYKIEPTLYPEDAYKSITWQSDNTSVATVSTDGTVFSVYPGSANITATTHNGLSATCTIEVPVPSFYLIVWKSTGEKIAFKLSEKPSISYENKKIYIDMVSAQLEFNSASISKYTIADQLPQDASNGVSPYDVNEDGRISIVDVSLLVSKLGTTSTTMQIDETINAILHKK